MLLLLMMGMATGGARAQQPVQGIQGTQENRPPSWLARELPAPRLAGQGRFTWFGMGIYRARLWVGPQGYRASAPQATPFVLDLRYERALRGSKIADASADEMEKIGAGSPAQRQAWRETMRTIFPDVKEGTHIAGVYVPGAGAHFYLDDQPLAQVDDPAFAAAFFAIWLSPATSARDLRGDLLRDAAPLSVAPVP
jgi:hypothetical protein